MSCSPVPVKVKRTYGKPKPVPAGDSGASLLLSSGDSSSTLVDSCSRFSLPPSAPSSPPSSPITSSKLELSSTSFGEFQFGGTKAAIQAIDEEFDHREENGDENRYDAFDSQDTFVEADIHIQDDTDINTSPLKDASMALGKAFVHTPTSHDTLSPTPLVRKPAKRRVAVVESDDEQHPVKQNARLVSPVHSLGTGDLEESTRHSEKQSSSSPKTLHSPKISVQPDHPVKRRSKEKIKAPKKPTKKEVEETKKEDARIKASRTANVATRTHNQNKYTIQSFIQNIPSLPSSSLSKPSTIPSTLSQLSDPIDQFSSPDVRRPIEHGPRIQFAPLSTQVRDDTLDATLEDSDNDLEDPESLMLRNIQEQATKVKTEELRRRKQQRLDAMKSTISTVLDDDDDLEIVPQHEETGMHATIHEEDHRRKTGQQKGFSEIQKRQRSMMVPQLATQPRSSSSARPNPEHFLVGNAKPTDLKRAILEEANQRAAEEIRRKEAEWKLYGGRIVEEVTVRPDWQDHIKEQVLKANIPQPRVETDDWDEEDGDSDHDYQPRGSPVTTVRADDEDPDATMVDEELGVTEPEEDGDPRFVLHRARPSRARVIVDSDSEDDTHQLQTSLRDPSSVGRVLVPDSSILDPEGDSFMTSTTTSNLQPREVVRESSSGEPTDDEDKENVERTEFSLSPISTRPGFGRLSSTVVIEAAVARTLSMTDIPTDDENDENARPTLTSSRSFLISRPSLGAARTPSFMEKLQSTTDPSKSPTSSAVQTFPKNQGSFDFSQFDDAAPALGASLTQDFEPTQKPRTGFAALRRQPSNFSLTQDIGLQPALTVSEEQLRRGEAGLGQELHHAVEVAVENKSSTDMVYVTEDGFLTQTRPDDNAPVYQPATTPSKRLGDTPRVPLSNILDRSVSQKREPLVPLSFPLWDAGDSPLQSRRSRIRKFGDRALGITDEDDDIGGGYISGGSAPHSRSSFKRTQSPMSSPFRGNPAVAAKKAKLKPQKSEFVVEEADESDEETGFGFGQKEKDDEDGEHLDAELTALMDHQEMDDKTLNEVKVAEKAREHAEEDDKRLEEQVKGVVDGEMRKKKRGGLGLDGDSDDDDDDDYSAREARRKMKEVRPRSDIEGLARDEKTRAFAMTYKNNLAIGADELVIPRRALDDAYWGIGGNSYVDQDFEEGDEQGESYENGDNDENVADSHRETITREELVQAVKEGKGLDDTFDENDLTFVEADMDLDLNLDTEMGSAIEVVTRKRKFADFEADHTAVETPRFGKKLDTTPHLAAWASKESKSMRKLGTGRSGRGVAVTGHSRTGKANVRGGGGSLRQGISSSQAVSRPSMRTVKKSVTSLGLLERNRSSMFES